MDTGKKKSMAAVICIFLIFVTFASLFYVAREEDHNCTGKDCPICACVHRKAGPSESGNNTCSRIFCQSGDLYRRNCYFAGVLDHFVDFVSSSKGKIK